MQFENEPISIETMPHKYDADIRELDRQLRTDFKPFKLTLHSENEIGGLNPGWLGYTVKREGNKHSAEYNYLQIIMEPDGWHAIVPQNRFGKRTLRTLGKVIGRSKEVNPTKIFNTQYRVFFPFDQVA